MEHRPPAGQTPEDPPTPPPQATGPGVARLPMSNAITAVIIAVATLVGGITVLLVMPGVMEALGTAVTITGSGFALAAKVAVPR
ncbi:hypothetical protein ACIBW9_25200 [Streptomyces sp. NPDC049541]|uniref:hypothetical protein n=1 Tax=Streptomyces sp. NPDC049541 TaxID=3365594 RepID=UPI0037A17D0F